MGISLRDLFVRIGFDVDEKPIKQLNSGIKSVKSSVLMMTGAFAAAAGGLIVLARSVANTGDDARKTAQALGLTTEALQELEFAASIGGIKQGELRASIRRLAKSANDASLGLLTYKRVYDSLGVSITNAEGKLKTTDQILSDVADKFAVMEDGTLKTAYATDLFGRSGAKLIPLLNQGAKGVAALRKEAVDLGYVIGDQDAQAAEEFNDSIVRLMAIIRGIKNQIGLGLIPIMTDLIKKAKEYVGANREFIKLKLEKVVKTLIKYIKLFYEIVKRSVITVKTLADAFGGLERIIKYTVMALAGFIALKFVYGIGLITQGIFGLVLAFKTLGAAAIAAKIAMFAVPLLIGVGVLALLLILEDIYRFFKGDDSITALIVDAFKNKFPEAFETTRKALQGIIDLFKSIKEVVSKPDYFKFDVGKRTDRRYGSWSEQEGGGFFQKLKNYVTDWQPGRVMNPTPQGQTVNSSNININSPISVNVPAGTPIQEVGPRVQAGVKDALGEVLRQTYQANKPQVAW